ncbi:hypothetical protein RUM44_002619 [Polyplax serrata]|uniref:Uncharacterized protein n=1 Tax=Polyplax serrata TaxID=468196 RepID=A0ABR1AGK7_POLSC
MATPDYEETEVQDLLQLPPASGIIKQGNCFPSGVLKTSNSSKNQLSVTILDFVQSSYSDNEDQKSFLSNLSTSGTDCVVNASNSDERRGSGGSQKEGFFSRGSLGSGNPVGLGQRQKTQIDVEKTAVKDKRKC